MITTKTAIICTHFLFRLPSAPFPRSPTVATQMKRDYHHTDMRICLDMHLHGALRGLRCDIFSQARAVAVLPIVLPRQQSQSENVFSLRRDTSRTRARDEVKLVSTSCGSLSCSESNLYGNRGTGYGIPLRRTERPKVRRRARRRL